MARIAKGLGVHLADRLVVWTLAIGRAQSMSMRLATRSRPPVQGITLLADKIRNTCYTFLAGLRQRKAPFFHEDIAMNSPLRRLGLACFIAAAIPLGGCLGEEGSTSEGTFSFQVGAQSVVIIISPRDSESGLVSGKDTTIISPRDSESGLVSGQDTAIVSPRDTESGLPTGKR